MGAPATGVAVAVPAASAEGYGPHCRVAPDGGVDLAVLDPMDDDPTLGQVPAGLLLDRLARHGHIPRRFTLLTAVPKGSQADRFTSGGSSSLADRGVHAVVSRGTAVTSCGLFPGVSERTAGERSASVCPLGVARSHR